MKTVFDSETRNELIKRIGLISENSVPLWGKMNICQMLKHCNTWDEYMLGLKKPVYKQGFIGKLFGKMALKKMTSDDRPLDKNTPTSKEFIIKDTGCDLAAEKSKWIAMIQQYQNYSNPDFIHIFFGKMTEEQIGILAYKHSDHHLRQFGA